MGGAAWDHTMVVSQSRRVGATLGQEVAGGQACWGPGFMGLAPSLPQEDHILQAGGRHGPPVFTVAGVWAGGGSGQSPLGLREGTSLGLGSAHLQEGLPTLGGSAQPLVSAGQRGPLARVFAHVRRRVGPDAQASEPRPGPEDLSPSRASTVGPSLLGAETAPREWTRAWCRGKETPQTHPGRRAEPGPQGYGNSPCPMAPSLFGNPKDPAPRPELRWACHPELPPTAPVGPQAAPAVGSGLVGLLPVRTKVGPTRCLAGGQPSPGETRVSETMGTRSHFSLSTGRGGAETLRSWRHGAAWGPPSPLRQACQETPGAPTRKSHNQALREASRKGVWMKGSVRERPQAPHTHMQSCVRVPTVTLCTGVRRPPSGAPGPPGPHFKPQARPPQGEGRAWLLQGWTADPVPSVLSRGLWEAGRVGVGRGPAPGQSDRASHCAPSARRAPAPVCGPWGEEAAGGPASARSRAFPGRVLRPWSSTGHRADLSGGRAGWGCGLSVHTAQPRQSPPQGPSTSLRALPSVHGAWLQGCWLARPHFLLARRLRAATGTKGGLCLILGLLPARPLPPRGPRGDACICSQAARAQRTDGLGYQPRAQEPRSQQPVLDPAGLPPFPHQLPEAPRWQPGSSMPAPRCLLCRHLPSPAHSMCLSSPSPARHPLAL